MIDPPKNRLTEAMKARGISRRDLAVKLDVTEHTILRLEKPGAVIPSKYLPTLATELGVDPNFLIGWDREPSQAEAA